MLFLHVKNTIKAIKNNIKAYDDMHFHLFT